MDMARYFASKAEELNTLVIDINRIIHARKEGRSNPPRKSLESPIKMRSSVKEARDAVARDKDEQFILDQTNKIFGG